MKQTAFALCTVLLAAALCAAPKLRGPIDFDVAAVLTAEIDADTASYCADKAAKVASIGRTDILVIGDSLSDFDRGRNHWAILSDALNKGRPGAFRVYNYAIAGDFAQRVLDRLDGKGYRKECFVDIWDRPYDWAFIMLGGNDTKAMSDEGYATPVTPPELEEKLYREFVARLKARGVRRVFLVSCARADWEKCQERAKALDATKPRHTRFGEPRHMEVFNAVLKKLADEIDGVEYLDIYTPMQELSPIADYVRADGVHLVDAGYRFVARRLLDHLAAMRQDEPVVLSRPGMTVGVPAGATAAQRYAAEELRDWTFKLSGVEPKIVEGEGTVTLKASGIPGVEGEESFSLKESGGRLVVEGGKRGLLYGVYELLERYGGVEWLSSWRTVVPENGRLVVPRGLDQRQSPAFMLRRASWFDAMRCSPDFCARCRGNGWGFGLEEKHGGDIHVFGAGLEGHTFYSLFPKKHFPTNEYANCYARNQVRLENPNDLQLCLTNPFVVDVVTSNLLAKIRSDPGACFYSVSKKDGAKNWCRCEKCAAVDAEEGSSAGTLVRFLNAVGERVEKEFPDARLATLVYTWSRRPCVKTKMRRNVVPYFCTYEADYSKPLESSRYPENKVLMDDIAKWGAQSSEMIIWDYVTDFYNYYFTYPNVKVLRPNLRFFRRAGARWLSREQGDSIGAHGDFAELKNWLLSKWMWDPSQPEDELIDRFLRGYYGAAAPYVREYLDGLCSVERDEEKHPMRLYESAEFGRVPEEFLLRATELWDKALAAVKGDAELEYNVRMGKLPVMYTRLMILRGPHAEKKVKKDASRDAEARELAVWVQDTVESSKFAMRFAENTPRHNTLRQCVWDLSGRLVPVKGATWRWTPNRSPYTFKLSEDESFPDGATRVWKKLVEARVELGDLKPGTTYYWWTSDNMGRHETGHFTTEGGLPASGPAKSSRADEKPNGSPDGFIQSL